MQNTPCSRWPCQRNNFFPDSWESGKKNFILKKKTIVLINTFQQLKQIKVGIISNDLRKWIAKLLNFEYLEKFYSAGQLDPDYVAIKCRVFIFSPQSRSCGSEREIDGSQLKYT